MKILLLLTSLAIAAFNDAHAFQPLKAPRLVSLVRNRNEKPSLFRSPQPSPPFVLASSSNDELLLRTHKTLWRNSWTSWWCQLPLSVVSTITLLFAKSIIKGNSVGSQKEAAGLFLTGTGVVVSFVSTFWTWGGTRLARRIQRPETTRIAAANMIRRFVKVGLALNLLGMGLNLVGAGAIIGGLAVKVLANQGVIQQAGGIGSQTIQPLDILVVQANTNGLLSHFLSLLFFLFLDGVVSNLDPPSVEGDERKRA